MLYRAAQRTCTTTTLVFSRPLRTPPSPFIVAVKVAKGGDGAVHILHALQPGDLVITADLPLASAVVARGGQALDPRGEVYSEDNVHERLAMRGLMRALRSGGELAGGPAPFRPSDRQRFASQLDRLLKPPRIA